MTNTPPTTLPVTSFATGRQDQNLPFRPGQESQSQLQNTDNDNNSPPRFVFRGEVLEQINNQDRRYRPQYNQDIDPQNREAISSYQQIGEQAQASNESDGSASGRIVDVFI